MSGSVETAPRLLPLGDSAWTVEFGDGISPETNARVMQLADRVTTLRGNDPLWRPVSDVVPTFRSLTVHFDPLSASADALGDRLLALAQLGGGHTLEGRHWRLPVCFEADFAPDLHILAQAKGLAPEEVIERLLATEFRVYMIGFLPGFPYMGGLPAELAMPRLASPRQRVPARSLAVAGEMCAIYPWESPGGWNLLGRTPVNLFDLRCAGQPAMLAAGDTVHWHAIDSTEYQRLLSLSERGELPRTTFLKKGDAP